MGGCDTEDTPAVTWGGGKSGGGSEVDDGDAKNEATEGRHKRTSAPVGGDLSPGVVGDVESLWEKHCQHQNH